MIIFRGTSRLAEVNYAHRDIRRDYTKREPAAFIERRVYDREYACGPRTFLHYVRRNRFVGFYLFFFLKGISTKLHGRNGSAREFYDRPLRLVYDFKIGRHNGYS